MASKTVGTEPLFMQYKADQRQGLAGLGNQITRHISGIIENPSSGYQQFSFIDRESRLEPDEVLLRAEDFLGAAALGLKLIVRRSPFSCEPG